MLNFKKLKRLLLVSGLFSTQVLADATCTITKSGATYTAAGCTSGGGDYDLIDNVLVKTSDASNAAAEANPIPGFYKTVKGKYVQCKSFGACEEVTPASSCTGGKLATVDSKTGLCLGGVFGSTTILEFATAAGDNYLVTHTANDDDVFSFAKSNVNYYVVKQDVNAIVFDGTTAIAADSAALKTNGKIIDRTAELCDISNSSGRYYSCTDGICTSTLKTGVADDDSEETVSLVFTVDITAKTCSAAAPAAGSTGQDVSTRGGYLLIKSDGTGIEDGTTNAGNLIKYSINGSTYKCDIVSDVGYYKTANDFTTIVQCKAGDGDTVVCKNDATDVTSTSKYNAVITIDDGKSQRFVEGTDYVKSGKVFGSTADYYKVSVTKDSMVLDKAGGKSYFIKDGSAENTYNIYECSQGECMQMKKTYHFENDSLYNCNNDGACSTIAMDATTGTVVKTGYYLAELKTTDENPKYYSLIECTAAVTTGEGASASTTPAKCSKVTTPSAGYYLDATQVEGEAKLIQCSKADNVITCENVATDSIISNGAYLNEGSKEGSTYGNVIICPDNECQTKEEVSAYYINAGETTPFGLIRCVITDKTTKKTACNAFNGSDGQVYLDYSASTIICSATGCTVSATAGFYVNSGNLSSSKLTTCLIQCTGSTSLTRREGDPVVPPAATITCKEVDATAYQVFLNQGPDKVAKQIIKCSSEKCSTYASMATEGNNEYYINGDDEEKDLANDVIECKYVNNAVGCEPIGTSNQGIYINANYAESGDKNQLIQCTSDSGCIGKKCTNGRDAEYYINAEINTEESDDLSNAVISCAKNKCEKITPTAPSYYVGTDSDINGLIACEGHACTYKPPFTSKGYYLNAGENRNVNQTIVCDANDGCESLKVDLGVYVNASGVDDPLIICDKEGNECTAVESPSCPVSTATDVNPGSYCLGGETKQLQFYNTSNATAIAASKTDNYYVYATVPSNVFPGMKGREISSLFKVSLYYINRYYQSGILIIDKNNKIVDNLVSGQTDIVLYDCDDTSKLCTQRPKCTDKTYMYDSENKKAIYCNAGTLENAEFTGYVVDTNRSKGSNHPYLIKCENDGKNCVSVKPESTSYFENSSYDAATNALILCSNGNCATVAADIGYYVGRQGTGIIQCTSATSCTFNTIKSRVKYVNAGADKTSSAIIECAKGKCNVIKARSGYYMTYNSSLLIYCSSSSSCAEFTPTVNHYDNADSTESSNTIINCVQNNQYITCAVEATNDGFYLSNQSNILIRCKSGNRCRSIVVKNGIFRGAIKESTGGSRRSDEPEVEDEEGKSVNVPRGGDEVYGIIRCCW